MSCTRRISFLEREVSYKASRKARAIESSSSERTDERAGGLRFMINGRCACTYANKRRGTANTLDRSGRKWSLSFALFAFVVAPGHASFRSINPPANRLDPLWFYAYRRLYIIGLFIPRECDFRQGRRPNLTNRSCETRKSPSRGHTRIQLRYAKLTFPERAIIAGDPAAVFLHFALKDRSVRSPPFHPLGRFAVFQPHPRMRLSNRSSSG